MNLPRTFPVVVKTGAIGIKIYQSKNAKGYTSFAISYKVGSEPRKVKIFSDYADAHAEAKNIGEKILAGQIEVTQLTGKDRLTYGHALEALGSTKVPLDLAAKEFAAAHQLLNGRVSLLEAVKYYVSRHRNTVAKDIDEAVDEMISDKRKEGVSGEYIKALNCYLGKLKKGFSGPVSRISNSEYADFLRGLRVSNRSKDNCRQALGAFFKYCKERGWLSKDHEGIEYLPRFKHEDGAIEIYTPAELAKLLSHAKDELVPFLAIAAFAGLRSAEIQRLDWSDVALEDGFITVTAAKAKTGSRRLVPVSKNLQSWLTPYFRKFGKVVSFANIPKQLGWLAEDAGMKWKKNALRHSFISYRLAEIQDTARVALEAGNSPQMIFKHYRELVRPAEAKRWFAIEQASGLPRSEQIHGAP
jgi:integrase